MKGWVAALCVPLAFVALGCTAEDTLEPVATGSCSPLRYEGDGEPDVIIVSDLPLRGVGAATTKLMVDAIELVLRDRGFRAGEYRVGYQSCNDTVGNEPFDPLLCRENARRYVATSDVIGVVGPWNSGCAVEQIPIVSRKEAGPLAMISPTNTFIGLTRDVPGADPMSASLYPDGVRSYFRVVTHDFAQGRAAAQFAARLKADRVAVIHQGLSDEYVRALTQSFLSSARSMGLDVRQFEWTNRRSYRSLAASVASVRPDAVYLSGLTQINAKQLIEDLRASLPRDVTLIGPDSFAATDIAEGLGSAGEGMYVTVPVIPIDALPAAGKRFARKLRLSPADPVSIGVPEAGQAATVLLDAVARSDGTRKSVVDELFKTKIENGILGSFAFDRFGDIVPAPIGLYRFSNGQLVADGVIRTSAPSG